MSENEERVKYVNVQLIATIGLICALILSFLLIYDKKLNLENKKKLFDDNEAQELAELQSSLVLFMFLLFLYVNYNQYKISKKYNSKDKNELLIQEIFALVSVISGIVGLIITISNKNKVLTISEIDVL